MKNLILVTWVILFTASCGGGGGSSADNRQWDTMKFVETLNTGDASQSFVASGGSVTFAIWVHHDSTTGARNVWVNRYIPATGWGVPEIVNNAPLLSAERPHLAVDTAGNAIAIWTQITTSRDEIWASYYRAGIGWEDAQPLETNGNDNYTPKVFFDNNGNAIATWREYIGVDDNVWTNRYTFGSGWGSAQLLETNSGPTSIPSVAFDQLGNAVAIWAQDDGNRYNIWVNHYTAGVGWSTAQLIETDNAGDATRPSIVFDSNNQAIAMWQQVVASTLYIRTNRFVPGMGWGSPTPVTTGAYDPKMVIDNNNTLFAIWTRSNASGYRLVSSSQPPGGSWSAEVDAVTTSFIQNSDYQLIKANNNDKYLIWIDFSNIVHDVAVNRYQSGVGWQGSDYIETDDTGNASNPSIAVDSSHNATAVWVHDQSGTITNIRSNRFE